MNGIAVAPTRAASLPTASALELAEAEAWRDAWTLADEQETGPMRVVETPSATSFVAPDVDVLFFNRVLGIGCQQPASPEDIDAAVHLFREAGSKRFFVQVAPPADTPEVRARLNSLGFVQHNRWAKFARRTDVPVDAQTDLRVEEADPGDAWLLAAFSASAFGWPAATQPFLARLARVGFWRFYVALDGDTPVAFGGMRLLDDVAYLGPAITRPQHRGRGAQSALIQRRLRDAAVAGREWAIAETAEDRPDSPAPSFRNLRRLGFRLAYYRPNYLLPLPETEHPPGGTRR